MKRISRFSLTFLLLFILQSLFVEARLMTGVESKLRFIFFNMSGSSSFDIWLKFAFFIILFAVLYNGGLKAMKAEGPMQRAMAIIAFVIALSSAILVPITALKYIFRMYSAILVILFAVLPAGIGYIINNKIITGDERWHKIIRAFVYILITIFIFGLIGNLESSSSPETKLYADLLQPLEWGGIFALIAGIYNLFMAMGGDKLWEAATKPATATTPTTPTPPPAGPTPPPAGTTPPGPGAHPAHPRNEAAIRALEAQMTNFSNRVFNVPDNINDSVTEIQNNTIAAIRGLIPAGTVVTIPGATPRTVTIAPTTPLSPQLLAALPPAMHTAIQTGPVAAAVGEIGALQPGVIAPARTLMETIFHDAHTTHQYEHITEAVRDNFEHAVAVFLTRESQIAYFAAFLAAI